LSLGAIVCPQCHTLLHSEQLVRISAAAKALEEKGELLQARDAWLSALSQLRLPIRLRRRFAPVW